MSINTATKDVELMRRILNTCVRHKVLQNVELLFISGTNTYLKIQEVTLYTHIFDQRSCSSPNF